MMKRVCVFTGTRAEYGLLKPLLEELYKDKDFKLQLLVSGTHLSGEFGLTYKQIERDGFKINCKVDILRTSDDTPAGISRSTGLGLIGFGKAYAELKPDIVIVLGDRFEAFAAAFAALVARIPIAHLYGGEATFGLVDEAIRHSITKMASWHFTSMKEYKKRVIQLGERPGTVFNVGAIALDNIKRLQLLSKEALEEKLKFKFNKHNLLVTFHPVTLEHNTAQRQFQDLLSVLSELKDTNIIFTKANADTYGRIINRLIDRYVADNSYRCIAFFSMGQLNYLSTMQFVDAVVGNSSSGIVEAPSFKIGTINIGDRQKGRIKPGSVIDCVPEAEGIRDAVIKLYSKEFQKGLKNVINPYGDGHSAHRIKRILKSFDTQISLKKSFYNIDFKYNGA